MRSAFAFTLYILMMALVSLPLAVDGFRPKAELKADVARLKSVTTWLSANVVALVPR
jgi:hypothetical protein